MAVAIINETIEIPNVQVQTLEHEVIGETAYTALGKLRADRITAKLSWELEAVYLTNDEYLDIYNHLDSINFGVTDFWLDEFAGDATTDSIDAVITITGDERVEFFRDGIFHCDGRNLNLFIREV